MQTSLLVARQAAFCHVPCTFHLATVVPSSGIYTPAFPIRVKKNFIVTQIAKSH